MLKRSVVERKMALLIARSFERVVSPAGYIVVYIVELVPSLGLPTTVKSMSAFA